jgi:hypothetical protein
MDEIIEKHRKTFEALLYPIAISFKKTNELNKNPRWMNFGCIEDQSTLVIQSTQNSRLKFSFPISEAEAIKISSDVETFWSLFRKMRNDYLESIHTINCQPPH